MHSRNIIFNRNRVRKSTESFGLPKVTSEKFASVTLEAFTRQLHLWLCRTRKQFFL